MLCCIVADLWWLHVTMWGCLKTPISIKWCFHALSFFPLIVFPSAGFTLSWNNSYCVFFVESNHMAWSAKDMAQEQWLMSGIPKTRYKSSKVGSVSHGPFLTPKVIVFVIVLLSFWSPLQVVTFVVATSKWYHECALPRATCCKLSKYRVTPRPHKMAAAYGPKWTKQPSHKILG